MEIAYRFEWKDGVTGTGHFVLRGDGSFEDRDGYRGQFSYRPATERLFLQYDPGQACTALFVGHLSQLELPAVRGPMVCRDGSMRSGIWAGTVLPPRFELPDSGCPMAHCDPAMSDWVGELPPGPGARVTWHDRVEAAPGKPVGSSFGLGCSGNGSIAACSLGVFPEGYPEESCDPGMGDAVAVYDYGSATPSRKWTSGEILNCTAWTSAPLVARDGSVIAADDGKIVRFAPNGTVVWETAMRQGVPISPVLTDGGLIVLARLDGPISAYDNQTGALVGELDLRRGSGRFETRNTPGASGCRIYVSTEYSLSPDEGRLYAIDVTLPQDYEPNDPASYPSEDTLREAWFVPFGGPSGASPLVVGDRVFFDGHRFEAGGDFDPHVLAVRDHGAFGQMEWIRSMAGEVQASFALDPRGGFWTYTVGLPRDQHRWLERLSLSDSDGDGEGELIERIDLDELVGEEGVHVPFSALSMAGTFEQPILLVGASAFETAPAQITSWPSI